MPIRLWPTNQVLFALHGWLGMNFGLLLPGLVWTGAYLSWRRAGIIGNGDPFRTGSSTSTSWWNSRTLRAWIYLLLTVVISLSVIVGYEKRSEAPTSFVDVETTTVGPWRAEVTKERSSRPGAPVQYSVSCDAGPSSKANLRKATIAGSTGNQSWTSAVKLNGPPDHMRASLPVQKGSCGTSQLKVSAQQWSGTQVRGTLHDNVPLQEADTAPRHAPAAPGMFFSVVFGYGIICVLITGAWFIIDVRDQATDSGS